MDTGNRVALALNSAVMALLRPLCRLLLRHQVPFATFEELAKHVYVQVAMEDFGLPGRKPTISRASILTGLTRKDVQRLVAGPSPLQAPTDESYNRSVRVLAGWARDAAFLDEAGRPRLLSLADGPDGFAALVRRYSGDMPARAMRDELLRVGAVRLLEDTQQLELVNRAYVPSRSELDKLGILGSDVSRLIATIDHNLQHGADDARFQRKVMYTRYPADRVAAFRKLSATQSQALLERLDAWLASHRAEGPPDPGEAPRVRLGIGIYYFEEPVDPAEEQS